MVERQKARWIRVTKKDPCPICKRPDWCAYALEAKLILCMRVHSDRPSRGEAGGWLHPMDGAIVKPLYVPPPKRQKVINALAIWNQWKMQTTVHHKIQLGELLGVEPMAIDALGIVWAKEHDAWAIPMRNGRGVMVGIRLRTRAGDQFAVEGSNAGLFMALAIEPVKRLYICEGASDAAAGLSMGLWIIGRHSCAGQHDMISEFVTHHRVREVVIIADNDTEKHKLDCPARDETGRCNCTPSLPGLEGAEKLQKALPVPSCIFLPMTKDLRQFYQAGGTSEMIHAAIKDTTWINANAKRA